MQGLEEPLGLERPQRGSSAALELLSGALSTTPDGTPRALATIEGLSGIFGREARSGGPARATNPHGIAGGADLEQPRTLRSVRSGGLPPGGSHSFSRSSARSGGMPPANRCAPPSGSAGASVLPPSTHALEGLCPMHRAWTCLCDISRARRSAHTLVPVLYPLRSVSRRTSGDATVLQS